MDCTACLPHNDPMTVEIALVFIIVFHCNWLLWLMS